MSATYSLLRESNPNVSRDKVTYVKVIPLRKIADVDKIIDEVADGNILIVRIAPLERWDIEEMKCAVNRLHQFTSEQGGDIARLSTERIVITPPKVKIWRGE